MDQVEEDLGLAIIVILILISFGIFYMHQHISEIICWEIDHGLIQGWVCES